MQKNWRQNIEKSRSCIFEYDYKKEPIEENLVEKGTEYAEGFKKLFKA